MSPEGSSRGETREFRRANTTTIQGKFLVQYNAAFTCPGDGKPIPGNLMGWNNWFHNENGILKPSFDLFPDVSDYSAAEQFNNPLLSANDQERAKLFSSRHPKTILRHFNLMGKYGVDGVLLRRRVAELETSGAFEGPLAELMKWRDEIGLLVQRSAEKEGRCFAIMYDVHGVPPERIASSLVADWLHNLNDMDMISSSAYLRESGRPVLMLKGFPFHDASFPSNVVVHAIRQLRAASPKGLYILLEVPAHWLSQNAEQTILLQQVIEREVDGISPRTLGRFNDDLSLDEFEENVVRCDVLHLKRIREGGGRKVDYIPTVWPGFSIHNVSGRREVLNDIPRQQGKLLWRQIWHAKKNGCGSVLAMSLDGYDNGTAFLPAVSTGRLMSPATRGSFIALDADGGDLPADWYLRVAGFASEGLKGECQLGATETLPVKELHDYWSSHPKYHQAEPEVATGTSTQPSSGAQPLWEVENHEDNLNGDVEPPPPPYSLEPEATKVPAKDNASTSLDIHQFSSPDGSLIPQDIINHQSATAVSSTSSSSIPTSSTTIHTEVESITTSLHDLSPPSSESKINPQWPPAEWGVSQAQMVAITTQQPALSRIQSYQVSSPPPVPQQPRPPISPYTYRPHSDPVTTSDKPGSVDHQGGPGMSESGPSASYSVDVPQHMYNWSGHATPTSATHGPTMSYAQGPIQPWSHSPASGYNGPPPPSLGYPSYRPSSVPVPGNPGQTFSVASNISLNLARTAVDRLAGEQRRRQMEKQADSLIKSGKGLLHKFGI